MNGDDGDDCDDDDVVVYSQSQDPSQKHLMYNRFNNDIDAAKKKKRKNEVETQFVEDDIFMESQNPNYDYDMLYKEIAADDSCVATKKKKKN